MSAQKTLSIELCQLHPAAKLPKYVYDKDAGADLFSVGEHSIAAGAWSLIPLGFSVRIPEGYEGQIRSKSGLAVKNGIAVLNSPGTIDSGYEGELKVILINHGQQQFEIHPGDKVAQLVIKPIEKVEFKFTEKLLPTSQRGDGGFGSTGFS